MTIFLSDPNQTDVLVIVHLGCDPPCHHHLPRKLRKLENQAVEERPDGRQANNRLPIPAKRACDWLERLATSATKGTHKRNTGTRNGNQERENADVPTHRGLYTKCVPAGATVEEPVKGFCDYTSVQLRQAKS